MRSSVTSPSGFLPGVSTYHCWKVREPLGVHQVLRGLDERNVHGHHVGALARHPVGHEGAVRVADQQHPRRIHRPRRHHVVDQPAQVRDVVDAGVAEVAAGRVGVPELHVVGVLGPLRREHQVALIGRAAEAEERLLDEAVDPVAVEDDQQRIAVGLVEVAGYLQHHRPLAAERRRSRRRIERHVAVVTAATAAHRRARQVAPTRRGFLPVRRLRMPPGGVLRAAAVWCHA